MPRRYLFGPVTGAFADQNLARHRRSGECLAFGPDGPDITIRPEEAWDEIRERLPPRWRPDFVVLYLPYAHLPRCLWTAPVPLIGLAADWNLCWHWYRRLYACALILTDPAGVRAFHREGLIQARVANLFGLEREFLDDMPTAGRRDIDVLFVGSLQRAVQRERLSWLGRLARLADRWNVVIRTGVHGAGYRELLSRARIVFNRSIRGECNRRAFEAAAAGALLFQEADNAEVRDHFTPGKEYVAYTDKDLERQLEYYLDHERERAQIAHAARQRARRYAFEDLWQEHLALIEREWQGIEERARDRAGPRPVHENHETIESRTNGWSGESMLPARVWQALSGGADPFLSRDLAAALAREPKSAGLHNALGVALTLDARGPLAAETVTLAAGYFQRALMHDSAHLVAGLNRAEALAAANQSAPATEQAGQTLALLDRGPAPSPSVWDAGHFPPGFHLFRVEWERAAWEHAGDPAGERRAKGALLRWRLEALLAERTGERVHYYEAAVARPDLPTTRAALGCALARSGHVADAVPHLRAAVRADPFDRDAARALFQALGESGDTKGQRRIAEERRLLRRAASDLVPDESWMARVPPPGEELVDRHA